MKWDFLRDNEYQKKQKIFLLIILLLFLQIFNLQVGQGSNGEGEEFHFMEAILDELHREASLLLDGFESRL